MKKVSLVIIFVISSIFAQQQPMGLIYGTENLCLEIDDGDNVWIQLANVPSVTLEGSLTRENWKYYIANNKKATIALVLQIMNSNAGLGIKYVEEGNLRRVINVWQRKGW